MGATSFNFFGQTTLMSVPRRSMVDRQSCINSSNSNMARGTFLESRIASTMCRNHRYIDLSSEKPSRRCSEAATSNGCLTGMITLGLAACASTTGIQKRNNLPTRGSLRTKQPHPLKSRSSIFFASSWYFSRISGANFASSIDSTSSQPDPAAISKWSLNPTTSCDSQYPAALNSV